MLPGVGLSAPVAGASDSDLMTASRPRPLSAGFSETVALRVMVSAAGESVPTPSGVELEVREMNPDSTVKVMGPGSGLLETT
ncbi:Uncharacterised protein [Mycobacteroides abscessus]|nr:Uncharacterised protein [Mycobacteroides abscessus]